MQQKTTIKKKMFHQNDEHKVKKLYIISNYCTRWGHFRNYRLVSNNLKSRGGNNRTTSTVLIKGWSVNKTAKLHESNTQHLCKHIPLNSQALWDLDLEIIDRPHLYRLMIL